MSEPARSTAKDLSEATRQYQAVLEQARRSDPDEYLAAETQRAWGGLWAAWARHVVG